MWFYNFLSILANNNFYTVAERFMQVESFWTSWVRLERLTVYLCICVFGKAQLCICVFVQLTVIPDHQWHKVVDESVGGELLDQLGGAG